MQKANNQETANSFNSTIRHPVYMLGSQTQRGESPKKIKVQKAPASIGAG